MNYIRIYFRFVIIYMKGKLEYHFSLLLELIANTILIGVYFAGFYVIFYNFNSIAGWNKYEVLFMFTTSWLSYSFSGVQCEISVNWFTVENLIYI